MASPGMMQVCGANIGTFTLFYLIFHFNSLNLTGFFIISIPYPLRSGDTLFYYINKSVLLENTPRVKFIQNHLRDLSGLFSISSPVKITMISLIPPLSLKLYLNILMYNQNIFGSSSRVFGNLR